MSAIRIGLYGGTFDPIHKGHMHVITQLFARDLIDELIVIPAGQPWMRSGAPIASAQDRLEMARIAVAQLPAEASSHVSVSDCEINRSGPSYTIDTVKEFIVNRPEAHFLLILGSDAYAGISNLHESAQLQSLVEILVIARDGEGLDINALPISATTIRTLTQSHLKDSPSNVATYIKEKNLYGRK